MKRDSYFRLFLILASLLPWAGCKTSADQSEAKSADAALAAGHTNQCIRDLGGLTKCQDQGLLGLPKDFQGCCDGLRSLAVDSCQCNPAIDKILGPKGTQVFHLEAACRFVQPIKWAKVTPFIFRQCGNTKTHDYGCEKTDVEIDAERFASIQKFQSVFATAMDEKQCLDTPALTEGLGKAFASDIVVNVPYGIGAYKGIQSVAEYLGMTFAGLTHGYWINDAAPDPTKRARLEVSADGLTWMTGSTVKGSFLRGSLPYDGIYFEQDIKFKKCDSLISEYTVHPTDGMRFLIERIVQTADLSKRWGVDDICRYHTQFCAKDPGTRQYESEKACLDYMERLPLYTQACGPNRPLNGHSISCKLKHHFMIPANPKMHCPHIGPKGSSDPDQHLKCDDVAECSTDEGQNLWPPITMIGDKTPEDMRKLFEKSNVDFKKEAMGCAVPSKSAEHLHN